jgi:hypothetical protein
VRTAVRWLFDVKAPSIRTSATQLKVGRISYYPGSGTIYLDGDRAPLPPAWLPALTFMADPLTGYSACHSTFVRSGSKPRVIEPAQATSGTRARSSSTSTRVFSE